MKPKPITRMTIAILMKTMMLLKRADSWMPMTSSTVRIATSAMAGMLRTPWICWYFAGRTRPRNEHALFAGFTQSTDGTSVCVPSTPNGADVNCRGM